MTDFKRFNLALSIRQRRLFAALTTPEKIQRFLDGITYYEDETYHCPLTTIKSGKGCCFEGALLAAAAMNMAGHSPQIVTLVAENDDDHVLAIYKKNGCFGAVAKSIYPCLRSRQPVYRTLRELVMSYFEFYFNRRKKKTLREYSAALNLDRFKEQNWLEDDLAATIISEALDNAKHFPVAPKSLVSRLPKIDSLTFRATSPNPMLRMG